MLAVVTDGRESLLKLAGSVIGSTGELHEDWLRSTASVVLPQEGALHFDEQQCSRLAAAFSAIERDRLVAVPLEEAGNLEVYRLDATSVDLNEFSFECGSLRYLLFPEGSRPTAAVVCTTDDFFMVVGPCPFVAAFAGDIASAEREFMDFVDGHFEQAQGALAPAVAYAVGKWGARQCDQP